MVKPFRIAIAGLGTVGAGVVKLLQDNRDILRNRTGRPVDIIAVSARDKRKDRGVDLSGYEWIYPPEKLLETEDLDAVIELIGGEDGPAYELVRGALEKGIHVITANKALLAHHGYELAALAEENEACLAYEAAVAGGIPAIKALREGLAGNRISAVYGILNGTSNYILTRMRETGAAFEDILKEAQDKGYAEADPSFDIGGVDAAHKICLLAAAAFGIIPDFDAVQIGGIAGLTATDIRFADELGFKIKLLGTARAFEERILITVEPCLVPADTPLGAVDGVSNAVRIEGDFIESILLTGPGAGAGPTASAVVADIIDTARGRRRPVFGIPASLLKKAEIMAPGKTKDAHYVRLNVLDQPGVLADVAAILRDHNISIESLLQHGRDPGQPVPVVIMTHEGLHADMRKACDQIAALEASIDPPCLMRVRGGL